MPTLVPGKPPLSQRMGGYPVAVLTVAAASVSVIALNTSAPVATLMLAVIVTTWFGGTRPALVAMAASIPPLIYALPPQNSWEIDADQVIRIPYFLTICGFIVLLVASERRAAGALRLVIDTIPTMAWILHPRGRLEFLNRRWLDYAGMSLEEAVARAHTTIHPDDAAKALAKWKAAMEKAEPYEDELRLRRADGAYRWFLVRTVPLLDDNGRVRRWYGTSADIDDRMSAEQALRESAERLQHLSRRLLEVHEEERRHFSRELHDEFGQLLVAINLQLHAAKSVAGPAAQPGLEKSAALLAQAADQVRGLALELRPTILETAGLAATLNWLAGQNQIGTGLTIEVTGELDEVPPDVAIACFRVVQQALTNVVQHAHARQVFIDLTQDEGSIKMLIRDDGRGFDAPTTLKTAPGQGHLGLLGMAERVEILGGSMLVDSAPGQGTRISVSVPVPAAVTRGATRTTAA